MDTTDVNLTPYSHAPNFDAAGGISLGHQLLQNVLPEPAKPEHGHGAKAAHSAKTAKAAKDTTATTGTDLGPVRRAQTGLGDAVLALETEWAASDNVAKAQPVKPIDSLADAAWKGTRQRAMAWLTLPPDQYPEVARAESFLATFFPDGLTFTGGDFGGQWAETEKRLQRIAAEPALLKDWNDLVGATFLAEVKRTHALYGVAIGTTTAKAPAAETPAVLDQIRALQKAMNRYSSQLIAVYHDTTDATLRAQILVALAPYDAFRTAASARRESTAQAKAAAEAQAKAEAEAQGTSAGETATPATPAATDAAPAATAPTAPTQAKSVAPTKAAKVSRRKK